MHVSFQRPNELALINVNDDTRQSKRSASSFALAMTVALAFLVAVAPQARAEETYTLTLKDNKFTPAELTVPADQRFVIEVVNEDRTPAEFESSDLRVEKFVVGGGKIVVRMRALKAGSYAFFDEYHPDTAKGTLIVK